MGLFLFIITLRFFFFIKIRLFLIILTFSQSGIFPTIPKPISFIIKLLFFFT